MPRAAASLLQAPRLSSFACPVSLETPSPANHPESVVPKIPCPPPRQTIENFCRRHLAVQSSPASHRAEMQDGNHLTSLQGKACRKTAGQWSFHQSWAHDAEPATRRMLQHRGTGAQGANHRARVARERTSTPISETASWIDWGRPLVLCLWVNPGPRAT